MTAADDPIDHESATRANETAALQAECVGARRSDALPMKFTFEFTGDCNLHCFFCDCEFGRNEFRREGIHRFAMDEALFRQIAEAAFPRATIVNPTVVGEALTFPHFQLMLDLAEKYSVKLDIVTNGMLLRGDKLINLMPLLDRLAISFDGGTKETFEHCRTGSTFEVVMDNLRTFQKLRAEQPAENRCNFSFAVTLMRENIEEFSRIVEIAHELGADEINASHLLVFTKALHGSSLMEHKQLSNRCIIEAMTTAERLGIPLVVPAPFVLEGDTASDQTTLPTPPAPSPRACGAHEAPPPDWAPNAFWCKFAWREVFVSVGGEIAPCCHQERPVMGNVFTEDWDSIWNSEEYQALRGGLRDGKPRPYCASCSLLAEQGKTRYTEKNYLFEDRYPDQTTADQRPSWPKTKPQPE